MRQTSETASAQNVSRWCEKPSRQLASPSAIPWSDCGNGFQCGILDVPRDYGDPAGPIVRLALMRLPASDPAQRIGSLVVNPSGPGESGVDFVRRKRIRALVLDGVVDPSLDEAAFREAQAEASRGPSTASWRTVAPTPRARSIQLGAQDPPSTR